ncbi:hypothetical protein Tco_0803335 [Tanacetum coccineum]|uniref:Uncharacterized protein n=1 Tax=Tanacetum coccineum TaxID=301880 RepID=A0ABQ5A4Z6_9ASTR
MFRRRDRMFSLKRKNVFVEERDVFVEEKRSCRRKEKALEDCLELLSSKESIFKSSNLRQQLVFIALQS